MSDPLRFAPPAEHPQSPLLGTAPRPDGLDDEQWETLRTAQTRRDRALFAAILFASLVTYEGGTRIHDTDDPAVRPGWLNAFAAAATYEAALDLVTDLAPARLRSFPDLLELVACVDPTIMRLAFANPDLLDASAKDARADVREAQDQVSAAIALTRPERIVPDTVPEGWTA